MQAVILRHIICEDLGVLAEPLRRRFTVRHVDMNGHEPPPPAIAEAETADLVVCLGGFMGAYDSDRYPFLARELDILGRRLAQGRPTLGICLGAQLMAAAAGARVYPSGSQEIGWYPIQFTAEAAADPVLGRLAPVPDGREMFFHWHGDTFDLPPGALLIGSSERFAHQGFRLGRHAIALQFHVEISPEDLEAWLAVYESEFPQGPGIQSPAELRAGARRHGPGLRARCSAFLESWLDQLWPAATDGATAEKLDFQPKNTDKEYVIER